MVSFASCFTKWTRDTSMKHSRENLNFLLLIDYSSIFRVTRDERFCTLQYHNKCQWRMDRLVLSALLSAFLALLPPFVIKMKTNWKGKIKTACDFFSFKLYVWNLSRRKYSRKSETERSVSSYVLASLRPETRSNIKFPPDLDPIFRNDPSSRWLL